MNDVIFWKWEILLVSKNKDLWFFIWLTILQPVLEWIHIDKFL